MSDDLFDVHIEPPNLVVEVNVSEQSDLSFTLEYDLKDILHFEGDGEIEIVDTHWHGIVIDTGEETEHIDLREVPTEL